jgi:cell division protein FtsL
VTRTNLLLLAVLVLSALLLVRTSYDARRLFTEIDRARSQERTLEAEFQRLDAERRVQATHLRVERVAREKLQMRNATAALTHYTPEAPLAAAVPGRAAPAAPAAPAADPAAPGSSKGAR